MKSNSPLQNSKKIDFLAIEIPLGVSYICNNVIINKQKIFASIFQILYPGIRNSFYTGRSSVSIAK